MDECHKASAYKWREDYGKQGKKTFDILREFLMRKRGEVLAMLVDEYEIEKYERGLYRSGYSEASRQATAKASWKGITAASRQATAKAQRKGR